MNTLAIPDSKWPTTGRSCLGHVVCLNGLCKHLGDTLWCKCRAFHIFIRFYQFLHDHSLCISYQREVFALGFAQSWFLKLRPQIRFSADQNNGHFPRLTSYLLVPLYIIKINFFLCKSIESFEGMYSPCFVHFQMFLDYQ